jgi:hypothetical protein
VIEVASVLPNPNWFVVPAVFSVAWVTAGEVTSTLSNPNSSLVS